MKCLHGSGVAILSWWPQKASLGRWAGKSLKVKKQAMQMSGVQREQQAQKQDGSTPVMSEAQEACMAAVEENPGKNSGKKQSYLVHSGSFWSKLLTTLKSFGNLWLDCSSVLIED